MADKLSKKKKWKKRFSKRFAQKPSPEMLKREKRAREAAYRLIAKQEKITIKEARKIYKEQGLVEFLYERPRKYARRKFIQIAPNKFRELVPGKPQKEEYATGPVRDLRYVVRVRRMKEYWQFVEIIKQEYRMSTKEARARITRGKKLGLTSRFMAGVVSGEYPASQKLLTDLFGED